MRFRLEGIPSCKSSSVHCVIGWLRQELGDNSSDIVGWMFPPNQNLEGTSGMWNRRLGTFLYGTDMGKVY